MEAAVNLQGFSGRFPKRDLRFLGQIDFQCLVIRKMNFRKGQKPILIDLYLGYLIADLHLNGFARFRLEFLPAANRDVGRDRVFDFGMRYRKPDSIVGGLVSE